MISVSMTSMNMLRQEAEAIGITEEEARKYGNIRHRRTWSLAIEHHLSIQSEADRIPPSFTTGEPNSSFPSTDSRQNEHRQDLKDYGIQLTANLGESGPRIAQQTAPMIAAKQPAEHSVPRSKSIHHLKQARSFDQVVQNHIKALKTASDTRTNSPHLSSGNWVCPECGPQAGISCHLCAGTGNITDIAAIGWTLAYMEMLGCSAREIEPIRRLFPESNILELNLKICLAIKQSTEVLARTEKWL
ncbi:hypothetical protein [Microcoleus sp. EPA2]|uniref:hypothetical protein n=1 Tax=Microcoleus sp. EPA2 TaxID=2841654 RepID=UPI00312BC9C8